MSEGLPEGWALPKLSDVAHHRSGNSKLIKGKLHARPGPGRHQAFSAAGADVWCDAVEHQGAAIILSAVGARCGKAFKADGQWSAIANTHIIRPGPTVDRDFLFLRLNDEGFWVKGGTAQPFVKTRETFEGEFPLPPLPEQRRIVTQVEALLEQVNRAKGRLDRVPLILKRFRQAVLAAACSGELTREWRADARIDQNWTIAAVGALCPLIQYGYTASANRGDGPRLLRITDIQDGRVVWATVPSCEISAADIKKFELRRGDIVFARSGATTGKSFLIAGCPPAVFASYLIRVRPGPRVTSKFLHLCFQTPDYWAYITENMAGNAQPNCNASKLAALEVPVPSSQEQDEIVRQVEKLFALADSIEVRVKAATARAAKLPQAILSKAFSGELVPTEAELARAEGRSYETAEELLRRVRAEQDASDDRGSKPGAGKSTAVRIRRAQSKTRAT